MPTPCKPCSIARDHAAYTLFCPSCIHCGARIIQHLGTMQLPVSDCTRRRKAMLKVWTDYGHSEATIRAMVKGPLALEPLPEPPPGPEKATASEARKSTKRR